MSTELAKMDEAMLSELAGLVERDDAGGEIQQIPVLKINYDPDSKFGRGNWVVGQKKDQDGKIVNEGHLVKGAIILMMKYRFSYFVAKDPKSACNSPFYNRGETVRGWNYGYVCGKNCPYRNKDPKCKNQVVYFALALTEEKQLIPCIAYLGGASWKAAQDYIDDIKDVKTATGTQQIPLYTYLTLLGSLKEKNAGTTYFVAQFKRGQMFTMDKIKAFKTKHQEAYDYMLRSNEAIIAKTPAVPSESGLEGRAVAAAIGGMTPVMGGGSKPPKPVDADVVDVKPEMPEADIDIPDTAFGAPTEAAAPPAKAGAAKVTAPEATSDPDFDIEKAIMQALGK